MPDNVVTLAGHTTRSELRFTPSGQATCSFGLAVNRVWTDRQSQEKKEQTSFFDVVCWGNLAENVATSLDRGNRVVVTGRLDQRTWETSEGDKRSKIEITADEVAPSLRWATVTVTKNERRDAREEPAAGHSAPVAAPSGYSSSYADDDSPF